MDILGGILRALLPSVAPEIEARANTARGPNGEKIRFREKATDISYTSGSYGRGYTKNTTTVGEGWSTQRSEPTYDPDN